MTRRRLFAIRKYKKGTTITTLGELMEQEFVWCHGKVFHKGWFVSWPMRLAAHYISSGALSKATKVTKEKNDE